MSNIPNFLTYARILVIPFLIVLVCFPNDVLLSRLATLVFILASITDFFDGYLARKMDSRTKVGALLDPIADKLLVSAMILVLVQQGKAALIPSIAIICREIMVSGLREFLIKLKVSLPVTGLSKIKTLMQLCALGFLICGDTGFSYIPTLEIGNYLLWFAAFLTILTGYIYLRISLKHLSSGK